MIISDEFNKKADELVSLYANEGVKGLEFVLEFSNGIDGEHIRFRIDFYLNNKPYIRSWPSSTTIVLPPTWFERFVLGLDYEKKVMRKLSKTLDRYISIKRKDNKLREIVEGIKTKVNKEGGKN